MEENVNSPEINILPKQEHPIYEIRYHRATFGKRIMANLVDIIIFAVCFVSLLLATRAIVNSSPQYKKASNTIDTIRVESCLYDYGKTDGRIKGIVPLYHTSNLFNAEAQYNIFIARIEGGKCVDQYFVEKEYIGYIPYIKKNSTEKHYQDIVEDYNKYRLSDSFVDVNKVHYFIEVDNTVIKNPNCSATYIDYVKNVYTPYIENTLVNTMVSCLPPYYEASKFIANMVSFVEIPIPFAISGVLVYLLPIFIFRRGRKTFGKAIYGIGLIDKQCLCPKPGRTAARFCIFYFGELLLSLLTFGIPFILSFSLMAFSKNKQGFPDYMLGLTEIDTHDFKIFFNKEEISLKDLDVHQKPVDFTSRL